MHFHNRPKVGGSTSFYKSPKRFQNLAEICSSGPVEVMIERKLEDRKEEEESVGIPALDLSRLKFMCLLGRGAKGAVFRIRSPDSDEDLALKVVLKASYGSKNGGELPEKKSKIGRIWFEREVLSGLRHPLLPKLRGFVETESVVGCAIDYCPGRDLNSVRRQQSEKMFSDDVIRFYGAELVLALEYLHKSGIVYRDLKPENVLIQENGHLMLVDFDLSTKLAPRSAKSPAIVKKKPEPPKKTRRPMILPCCNSGVSPEDSVRSAGHPDEPSESESVAKSNSFVGTEDYVAPEIIAGNGHDFAVDWWCLGVVLYEMLYGTTPFRGANRKETFYRVISKAPSLVGETTPLRDLIGRLLEKDPVKRIQLEEIKGHDFFRGIDWEMIWRIGRPPFIPAFTEWEEEMEGINGVDVENIVQGIFGGDVEHDVKSRGNEGNLKSDRENENKEMCGVEADNFLVF